LQSVEFETILCQVLKQYRKSRMAQTPEAKVKLIVTEILDKYNVYYFKPATGGYGRSGVPDIVGCYHGKFIAIECKAGKNKPTALQEREIKWINESGGHAIVINADNTTELVQLLMSIRASSLIGNNNITLAQGKT
jgi:Archaeal holliday junction resolvase (hjc)